MRKLPVLVSAVMGLALAGCGSAGPPAVNAETTQGNYRLALELPKATWQTTEEITGTETVSLVAGVGLDVYSDSEGPTQFEFDEVGGQGRSAKPAYHLDCHPYPIDTSRPITNTMTVSGGTWPEDPQYKFMSSFLANPTLHLPAGDWNVVAVANFHDGSCVGPSHTIRATVAIHVTG
jgi:hypothetical protein